MKKEERKSGERDFVHRSGDGVARREALLFWHRNIQPVWNDDDDLPAQVTYNSGWKEGRLRVAKVTVSGVDKRERGSGYKLGPSYYLWCGVFSVVVLASLVVTIYNLLGLYGTHIFFSFLSFFLTVLLRRNWLVWRQAVPQKGLDQIEKGESQGRARNEDSFVGVMIHLVQMVSHSNETE